MKIFVKAKPGAKEKSIQKINDECFIVAVKELPIAGKANTAIIKILADYFSVMISEVKIVSGYTSRNKIIEIKKSFI